MDIQENEDGESQTMDALAANLSDDDATEIQPDDSEVGKTEDGDGKTQETLETEAEVKADDADTETESDEDFIEWGEGDDTRKATLDELIDGYENPQVDFNTAPQVQARMAELEKQGQQATIELQNTVNQRQQWSTGLEQLLATMPSPQEPDARLIQDNPHEYNAQLAEFQQSTANREQALNAYQVNQQQLEHESSQLRQQDLAREATLLKTAWPEFENTETQNEVKSILKESFGIGDDLLGDVIDHRFYLLAKAAVAHVKGEKIGKKATKALKSKSAPRRVKARTGGSTNPKTALAILNQKLAAGKPVTDEEAMLGLADVI